MRSKLMLTFVAKVGTFKNSLIVAYLRLEEKRLFLVVEWKLDLEGCSGAES